MAQTRPSPTLSRGFTRLGRFLAPYGHEGATWDHVSITFEALQLHVTLNRDREHGGDQIHISYSQDPSDPVEVSRSLIAIQRQFLPLNRAVEMERALGPEMAEFYRRREEGLSRLEALTQKLVKDTHDYRLQLDVEMAEHKQELTASFDERNRALEAKHEAQTAEFEAREQDLTTRRRELDDRSARLARREQSRALQQKISDRSAKFTLTSETRRKRIPVHVILGSLLLFSGSLTAYSLLVPTTATEGVRFWLGLGRLPLGALGFALTAIFYIRWTDQWFRQHADQEFRLQQLALDVDRAGYAVEMLLEWQEDKGGEMPCGNGRSPHGWLVHRSSKDSARAASIGRYDSGVTESGVWRSARPAWYRRSSSHWPPISQTRKTVGKRTGTNSGVRNPTVVR